MTPGPISGEWPSMPPAQPPPVSQSTPVTIGLVVVVVGMIITGAIAWGRLVAQGEAQEQRLAKVENLVEAQSARDNGQDLLISSQGKDIGAVQTTVDRIDRRMQRWEDSGFVKSVRSNGGR